MGELLPPFKICRLITTSLQVLNQMNECFLELHMETRPVANTLQYFVIYNCRQHVQGARRHKKQRLQQSMFVRAALFYREWTRGIWQTTGSWVCPETCRLRTTQSAERGICNHTRICVWKHNFPFLNVLMSVKKYLSNKSTLDYIRVATNGYFCQQNVRKLWTMSIPVSQSKVMSLMRCFVSSKHKDIQFNVIIQQRKAEHLHIWEDKNSIFWHFCKL